MRGPGGPAGACAPGCHREAWLISSSAWRVWPACRCQRAAAASTRCGRADRGRCAMSVPASRRVANTSSKSSSAAATRAFSSRSRTSVDGGLRLDQKDLLQAPERRDRVRELVAVDENSGQRKMGVKRARVGGVEAERVSRLESSRRLTFGFTEPAVPQRDARGQRRREHKRRDLIARVAGPQSRVGLIGLIGQQVAADQVHPRASAGDPEVQARLDRLRPPGSRRRSHRPPPQ